MVNEDQARRFPFWDSLSEAERAQVRDGCYTKSYERGSLIHSATDECLGMLLLLSGEIRVFLLSEEGREITLFRLAEGDCCVLSASCVISQISFDTHLKAESNCKLLILRAGVLARLAQYNIYVRCFVYELATEHFSAVMWSMQQILFKGFDRRLASFFIAELDRTGKPVIRMTHEQIAQNTSSAREVVARMLKRFAADGLVSMRRGCIELKDTDALRRLAGS